MAKNSPGRLAKNDKLRVIIHTRDYIVKGEVYLYEESRLSDILNAEPDKLYLALTGVTMTNNGTGKQTKKGFVLMNKRNIEILYLDEQSKDAAETYTKQAKSFLNNLNFEAAITEARRAISIDETNAEAHYILGIALGKKQLLDQAVKEFQLAYKYAENGSRVHMLAQDMINQIKI